MTARPPPAGSTTRARRKLRPRPTPKWLLKESDLDAIARRRLLMVLSVLSGERAVTEVLAEADIARGTYYQLEDKALRAMLAALSPDAVEGPPAASSSARIAQLEARVKTLEQDKRRAERLLYLTRKVVRPGPYTTGLKGRPRGSKNRPSRPTPPGSTPSTSSSSAPGGASPSTPTKDSGDGR